MGRVLAPARAGATPSARRRSDRRSRPRRCRFQRRYAIASPSTRWSRGSRPTSPRHSRSARVAPPSRSRSATSNRSTGSPPCGRRAVPSVKIRLDANGAWDVETALRELAHLAAYDIELVEDPVASLEELAALRGRTGMPVAAESCIRTTADARRLRQLEAADAIVLKPQRIGGVREALRAAEASGVPAIASSALETSVGLAAVVALAAALPDAPFAHGAGTALLLESDVVAILSSPSTAGSPRGGRRWTCTCSSPHDRTGRGRRRARVCDHVAR